MSAPDRIKQLVDNFGEHLDHYKSQGYNETEVRREYLDPFWRELGWDIDNREGYADQYKDVVHEDAIKVEDKIKAPDYSFRIGGVRKFFLEAKKPAVNIQSDLGPAYQLRRYAWSAKLPLSVLSDFEEFAVYDCRFKPKPTDSAATARTIYVRFDHYEERWDEIAGIFSREAILRGSFDKYVSDNKRKKGTAEVDDVFLSEIERWRELLAKNIVRRNPGISIRDLNYAVQAVIDRIIFLRICEDRGTEDYQTLAKAVAEKDAYAALLERFRAADARYNSGLFHFTDEKHQQTEPDRITPGLTIDNAELREIVGNLYYPKSPYAFTVLPPDILGHVYEQFLGKTITLTGGEKRPQVRIEQKPEVRKAGGVYYTPTYIVDYIVENTLGRLLNGDDPENPRPIPVSRAAELKLVDPACGSGSFLIVAYQYLLDWHRDQYTLDYDAPADPETGRRPLDEGKIKRHGAGKSPKIFQDQSGEYRLTIAERKRILLNNIHGVDIDSQAVEVTKLSLLLKVLEGESDQVIQRDLFKERERVLPNLGNNIQCGNSLIGHDFYAQPDLPELDDETRYRINVFDWESAFPEVFANGGFDCVVGNPPYVRMELFKPLKSYLRTQFESHDERADLYNYFLERILFLSNDSARSALIVSNKFLQAKYGGPVRTVIANSGRLHELADFAGLPVFKGATVRTIIVTLGPKSAAPVLFGRKPTESEFLEILSGKVEVREHVSNFNVEISRAHFDSRSWLLISDPDRKLLDRLRAEFEPFHSATGIEPQFGVKTGFNAAFIVDQDTRGDFLAADQRNDEAMPPIYFGKDLGRYVSKESSRFLIYLHGDNDPSKFPSLLEHLQQHRDQLLKRAATQDWFQLQQPAERLCANRKNRKIVYPIIAPHVRFSFDDTGALVNDKCFILETDSKYILGVLNSAVANFYFTRVCAKLEGLKEDYFEFRAQYVRKLPIRPIDFTNPADVALHDRMVTLVDTMLDLHRRKATEGNPATRRQIEAQIAATDSQIDRLVYELYGLTAEEIALVEASG